MSVLELLSSLKKLYATKVVPDTEDFNRLLMLVVAEVADNTRSMFMRSYPDAKSLEGVGPEALKKDPEGRTFPKGSVQRRIVSQGIPALERCASKFLETGGGRFVSPLDLSKGKKKVRRRPPGKALMMIYTDFFHYDNAKRKMERHLPAASVAPYNVKYHRDGEYQCGVLRRQARSPHATQLSDAVVLEVRAALKQVFKVAKAVGQNLAKSLAPSRSHSRYLASEKEDLQQSLYGSNGLLTNLRETKRMLQEAKVTSASTKSLASFLEDAVAELYKIALAGCETHLRKEDCERPTKPSQDGKDGAREKKKTPQQKELPLLAGSVASPSASKRASSTGSSSSSSSSSSSEISLSSSSTPSSLRTSPSTSSLGSVSSLPTSQAASSSSSHEGSHKGSHKGSKTTSTSKHSQDSSSEEESLPSTPKLEAATTHSKKISLEQLIGQISKKPQAEKQPQVPLKNWKAGSA